MPRSALQDRLRTGIMAGSPCPIEVMKRVMEDLNMKEITICYGKATQVLHSTRRRISSFQPLMEPASCCSKRNLDLESTTSSLLQLFTVIFELGQRYTDS